MNKRILIILISCTSFVNITYSQYYFKELLSTKQLIADRNTYQTQKIRTIIVHSLEADGEASEGFFCEKKINKDYSKIETETRSNISGKSILTTYFNTKGLPIKTTDETDAVSSVSTYQYDNNNNLVNLSSYSFSAEETDTALYSYSSNDTTALREEHLYSYNDKGQPVKMLRIKNKRDTTVINFTLDEKGNVTDEMEVLEQGRHFYYYYSENNRLTDIVKYNVIKKKLLPDFIFEYNTDGQLLQMVSTEEGANSDYFIWKYFYGDDGLRIIEKCFSKERDLLGSFEYEYK